jgi:hypothetical protein
MQDSLTGYVHEVPDFAEWPETVGEPVYDGFGNPVGFLPALPAVTSFLPSIARGIGRLFGGRKRRRRPPPMPEMQPPMPEMPPQDYSPPYDSGGGYGDPVGFLPLPFLPRPSLPGLPFPSPGAPFPAPSPMPPPPSGGFRPPWFRRPWPLGWIRPQLPYTGLGPNRLYMRCAVWAGPRGLVPAYAAQAAAWTPPGAVPPIPVQPPTPIPGQPPTPLTPAQAAAVQQAAMMGRRRRRRRLF